MLSSLFGSEIVLNLSGQGLSDLPADIAQNVTAIVAQNNKIVALPASIRGLPNLTRLDLDNNLLRHLPSCVYRMANLAHLSVRNNLLTKLEPELINMRKLKVLALDGNPLAYPPLRVASLKLPKLLEWMQKNPSYTVFRTYFDRQAETVSFVDLNIATAHAQVKASKKNEDRWENCVFLDVKGSMEEADREVRLKHIDLDDMSQHFRQGNIAPNKSNLNVFRSKAVFIGMYDGHGGNAASGALQQNLLKMAKKNGLLDVSADDEAFDWDGALKKLFVEVDEKLCDALVGLKKGAGSTCTIGIILTGSKTKLIVAHVGDSRAVASVSVPPGFLELTKDHCPSDEAEKAACEARGGKIARKKEGACLRVNGDLNMTRSFGDVKWKRPVPIISNVPDVKVITLNPSFQCLIFASDGLWCYMNSEMGSNYARNEVTAEDAARAMVNKIKYWIEGTSHKGDNTSVTVVFLNWIMGSPVAAEVLLSSTVTAERVLSVAWPLNALAFWFGAGVLLSVSGAIGPGFWLFQISIGFWCVLGGFLATVSLFSSWASQPPLPLGANLAYAANALVCLIVFQVFLTDKKKNDESVVASVCVVLFLSLSMVVLAGTAAQNVAFATRFDKEIHKPEINGTRLFVSCLGSGSTMVLIVGDIDHTAVYYMPLQKALGNASALTVCVYDSAGAGFSESGSFPRSPTVLAEEASGVVDYLLQTNPSVDEFFVLGCGHGGIVLRLLLQLQYENIEGVVLIDSLSVWDPDMLGAALGISASQYIDSVVAPAVADLNVQHSFAPVGLCLFNQFVATDSFAALPVEYFALQRSSRCNGGAMAAASASATTFMYEGPWDNLPSLGNLPLYVLCSEGPFTKPIIGDTLNQIQKRLARLSTSSTLYTVPNSLQAGDLEVLHLDVIVNKIVGFLTVNK